MASKPARVPPKKQGKSATAKKPIEPHKDVNPKSKGDGMIARATVKVRKGK